MTISLDGLEMIVSGTAAEGVVGPETRLRFTQRGSRIVARYAGGRIVRGWLAGWVSGERIGFRYLQKESSGEIHGGESRGELCRGPEGRIRILEHFVWATRSGSGTNVFDEVCR